MELLKVSVGVLWVINLGLLIWYMVEQEVNGWNITALVGVALTGIVPMLFGREKKEYQPLVKKREGWATFVHVISGVIGTAGSGLALGYAAQCGKSSYANIELLVAAAVVNGLSGIVAHFAFIDNDEQKKIYEDESLAYSCCCSRGCCSRGFWYLLFLAVATLISLLTAVWNHDNEYKNKCDNEDHYNLYFISPITHLVGSLLLGLFSPKVPLILNFTIMYTAAILSMFGLNLTYGGGGDWAIVIPVYLYLATAHVKFASS